MPPLGLSAGVRKAQEIGRRAVSLARARPRMVNPQGHYEPRPHDSILVLQRGENASTDYYIRGRLSEATVPVEIADLDSSADQCRLLADDATRAALVIVCRYASKAWLDLLQVGRDRLSRVAYFMDDDLPAMIRDSGLPRSVRSKVALHFGEHVDQLDHLASEVWVSSPVLAERYADARPRLLSPLPEADPPEPAGPLERRVVYHGTDVHGPERRFVVEVARTLAASGCDALVEITGDHALRAACAGLANVTVTPQLPWPEYRRSHSGPSAAISLAPLFPSEVNDARAPVKAFDAARLGATGLYADAPPYRRDVRPEVDGLILPMVPDAWAEAIIELLSDAPRRMNLAHAARGRLIALRRSRPAFPTPMDT